MARPRNAETIPRREREIVTLIYLAAILPFLGLLIAAMIAFAYQQRSRTIVFHAKQAMVGQAVILFVSILLCLVGLFGLLIGGLSPVLREVFVKFGQIVFSLVAIAYVLWCFYFAWMSLEGRDLDYPLIGARLRGGMER